LRTVHQLDGLAEEWITDCLERSLQTEDTIPTGFLGQLDDPIYSVIEWMRFAEKGEAQVDRDPQDGLDRSRHGGGA
jgi:hypothetical protein